MGTQFLNSKLIKTELMKHYRFDLGYPYVATECIKYSDVNACNDKALVEIEVKCSLQDLKAEFKTAGNKHDKHFVVYCNPSVRPYAIIPNYYYIAVPEELKQNAVDIVKQINTNYGVLVCKKDRCSPSGYTIVCAKKARKLHGKTPDNRTKSIIAKRITSELITLRQKYLR